MKIQDAAKTLPVRESVAGVVVRGGFLEAVALCYLCRNLQVAGFRER